MSMHKSQQQYEQSLQEALDRYRHLTTINEWILQKTEKEHLQHSSNISIQLWKYKDAHKVTLNYDPMTTPPSWSMNDWRSLLETDSSPGLNQMVEKRQVITRLDKHTRVSRIKMKDGWRLGSHERILIEQIIQHSTSLRYIATSTQQDDLIQNSCLDIQYPTNQPGQQFNVTFYCQWAADSLSSVTSSERLAAHTMSMITGCLTSLSLYTPIPFISHQDSGIQLDYNIYDPLTRTLDIKYHFGANDDDTSDSRSPTTTNTIKIHRHLSPHIPSQSRSWDPPYEPVLSSSLRKHDFMSSSLVFRPSSPGSGGHRLPPIGMTKKLSTVDLSSSYSSNSLRKDSPPAIAKGEQLIIDIDGDNKNNNGETIAHLTLQLLDSDNDLGPFLTNQFAQLCLRCIKYYPYDIATSASRHSLILHHPESLLGDLKLPRNSTQLSVRITLVLKFETSVESSGKNVATTGDMRLLLNGKQWPIRNTMPWDATIDESDQDEDESGYDDHGKNMEDDLDGDPFMDSMEDVHESTTTTTTTTTTWNSDKQLDQPESSQNPTPVKSSSVVESATAVDSTGFSLAKKSHQNDMKSTLQFDERSQPSDRSKLEHTHSPPAPESSPSEEKSPKQRTQNKLEDKQVENDDKPLPTTLSQRRPPSSGKKINIPHVDPPEMLKAYQYFDALLHSNDWHITQKPDQNNGFATIMKMDVDGHPTGVLLCETVWKHCSIWDAKAVLSCSEAREIWDSMFEKGEYICSVTPSCSIWHSKLKSAWPASPRDYVAFTAQYTSSQRVDICSTSCIGNTYEHYHLPKETSDFVRATLDLSGWRLDRLDADSGDSSNSSAHTINEKRQSNSISVRYVLQTHFQGWIPWFLLNQLTTQAPNVPTSAYQYLERYGAPPCVEELIMATIQQHRYDHTKKNWRLEYTRSITTGEQGPTTVTVRLDRRRWAFNSSSAGSHYNITVDPPPSKVVAEARKEDPYGVWLIIEHDESFIIPRRGKILVLIKPGKYQQHQSLQKKKKHNPITLMVNGTVAPIQNDTVMTTVGSLDSSDLNEHETPHSSKTPQHMNPSPESVSPKATASVATAPSLSLPSTATADAVDDVTEHIRNLEVMPMEQAQASLLYLKRMDEQFGWTVVSDKQGLRINKRSGTKSSSATAKSKPIPSTSTSGTTETTSTIENGGRSTSQLENHYLDVCDPCMIYKSSKVIENFSIEEVASVVTNISDVRTAYDSSLEKCEVVKPIQRGCQVIRQEIKGIFPFKSRELYMVSCTAVEKTVGASSSKRILYVESSIDIPVSKSSKLPRGKMFISGWILEPIDPYTTAANHPIPSMRATYVIALDLGSSVPSYLSNMAASGIVSKKIHGVEQYLKQKGPLPYLVHPPPVVGFRKNKCVDIQTLADDEDNDGFLSSSNSNSNNSGSSKSNTSGKDADKPIYPSTTAATTTTANTMKSTKLTTLRWCDVQAIYGQEPVLSLKSLCQYQQPPPPTTPRSAMAPSFTPVPSPNQQQPSSSIPIQPTASHSSSWMDRRRSSTSTAYSTASHRRGSLPPGSPTSSAATAAAMVAATKQRKIELENSTHSSTPASIGNIMVDPILCEVVVDLQMFSQGYDVMVNFRQHQITDNTNNAQLCDENDLSGLLSVTVSELTPTPSHILLATMGGSSTPPGKHSVQVKLIASSLSQTTLFQPKDMDMFDLELTLQHHQPVVTKIIKNSGSTETAKTEHDSDENERKDRLTMSDILGDDNDDDDSTKQKSGSDSASRWQGVVFVDGQMVSKYGEEVKIKSKRKPASSLQSFIEGRDKKLVTFSSPFDSTGTGMDYNKSLDSTSTNDDAGQQQQQQQHEKLDDADQPLGDSSSGMASSSASSSVVGEPTAVAPYLGESVVSAALGGVNDFRMRLMFPFKNQHSPSSTTTSTTLTTSSSIGTSDSGQMTSKHPQVIGKDDQQINSISAMTENGGTTGNRSDQVNEFYSGQVTTQHGTSWTLRMVISIGMIGLCILCVMALLLLQPRPVVFEAGQPIYSLCRFPWFGGWQIQLVASDSSSFTMT